MRKKLLNGILIGFGVVVMLWLTFPFGVILALAFWIYLGVMFWKGKPLFQEDIEQGFAKRQMKKIKVLNIAAGISFIVGFVGIIMHNVRSGQSETEDSLFFFIGIIAMYLFILASIAGLVLFLKGRQKSKSQK